MSGHKAVEIDNETIKKILNLKWLGLDKVTHIENEDAVAPGENFGSVMKRVTLTGEKNGITIMRKIMMKRDRVLSKDTTLALAQKEIEVYTKVLTKYKELIDELPKDKTIDIMWPICLGVRNYDVILMEDLLEAGFASRERKVPMPPEVAIACSGHLGRFHALSLVAIKRNMVDVNLFKTNLLAANWSVWNNLLSGGLITLADSIESDPQWKSIVPKLRQLAENLGSEMVSMAEKVKYIFPVINHGDAWSNNILFKFDKDSKEPTSMKFVDYQNSHYSCFGWDIVYLLNTSMKAPDKQTCFKQVVETYRSNLVGTLEAFQEDTDQVPSLDDMFITLDKLGLLAMVIAFSVFPLTINNVENGWDIDEPATNDEVTPHNPQIFRNKIFQESFKLDAVRFKSQGLL